MHQLAERPPFAAVVREPLADGALLAERHEFPGPAPEQLAPRVAEQRLDPLRKIGVAPFGVRLPDIFAGDCGDIAEALVGGADGRFGALARIDVRHHARHVGRAAVRVAHGDAALGVQPFPPALAVAQAQLDVVLVVRALQRAHQRRARFRQVVRMQQALELHAARDRRRALMAEKTHPAVAGIELVAVDVVMPLGEVAAVERPLEARLRLRQARLGAALLGDVASDAAIAAEGAVGAVVRLPGDDVHLPRPALVRARDLEIVAVRGERARLHLDARDLPEALAEGRRRAEQRRHRPAAREPGDAVVGVGLPEPVGGELGEAAQPLLVRARARELALAAPRNQHHGEIDHRRRDGDEQQRVGDRIQAAPSRTGGATLSTSSMVVRPAPTFIAPLTRSGFMPSLNACSRSRPSSTVAPTMLLNAGVSTSVS